MAKSVIDLNERTSTASDDILHVNAAGTDYKQTKDNFLQGDFHWTFNNTSTLISQVDALPSRGCYIGRIASYNAQSVCDVPANANHQVIAQVFANAYRSVRIIGINDGTEYIRVKNNGTWSDWELVYTHNIPRQWNAVGDIIKSVSTGTAVGRGYAFVRQETPRSGTLDFAAKFVTAGTLSNVYDVGISVSNLQAINANIPDFSAVGYGKVNIYTSSGAIDVTHTNYGGLMMSNTDKWYIGRMYQLPNSSGTFAGQWSDSAYAVGMMVEGSIPIKFS